MSRIFFIFLLLSLSSKAVASFYLVNEPQNKQAQSLTMEKLKNENFFQRNFMDPEDDWFDINYWMMENPLGFFPIPYIISESSVGNGMVLGLLFLSPQEKDYTIDNPKTPDLYFIGGSKNFK